MRYDVNCRHYEPNGTLRVDSYTVIASNAFPWCKVRTLILKSIGPFGKYGHPTIECTRVAKTDEPLLTFEIKKNEELL